MSWKRGALLIGLAATLAPLPAAAIMLDFESFNHGEEIAFSEGVTISTTNFTGPELGLAFDTNFGGTTSDNDLVRGGGTWSGGNLAPSTDLGIILIIQEHTDSCSGSAPNRTCTNPDDEGYRPAGIIEFNFSGVDGGIFYKTSFDLIDVEDEMAELGYVEFCLGVTCYADVIEFGDGILPGVTWGNNTANRVTNVGIGEAFDVLKFHIGGSGGLNNVAAVVPEPGATLLFTLGFGIVGGAVRRRRIG
jgi:hypothetical protein